ncbi:MAG: hypothetical protein JW910_07420, partial [Anaerolineae bacterium]|nr:hypothetical protein [Anaerolineae bacterium]
LADFIATTWLEAAAAGEHLAPALGLVLAAYVHGGRFFPRHAWGYYALRYLADDFAAYLAGLVSDQIAQRVVIHLWHDGTAAALVYAPSARAVVIQLGTALGVGFAPESDAGLCPLGPGFVVT